MKAISIVIALVCLSPCIVASLHSISKIGGNWWLIPAGVIIGAGLVMVGTMLIKSDKKRL